MIGVKTSKASVVQYELEIEINASCERVWKAIVDETNVWWLPDFHMVGPGSRVTFDPNPGGAGLIEHLDGRGVLSWYTVQYYLPQEFTIYLVGHVAPDWGGPSTSHLKLNLDKTERGCTLKVADAQLGNVSAQSVQSASDGWSQLFRDGLKLFVEEGTQRIV